MKRNIEDKIPGEKGVYVLFLKCSNIKDIRVGSLGIMQTEEGIYAYIGSAYGGGGIKSRLGRHLKTAKKCRWHIDYIRRHMSFHSAWYTTENTEMEHLIAGEFIKAGAGIPLKGFGSSDCNCISHLFHMNEIPEPFFSNIKKIT